ncbi:hypothetical protein [Campylobacter vulpis]|uniref:Uncharacterized protein n=1 Tax=Campylobacter vulpis TaxID=1655500 RepID=A0A2G4R424_9BACT|nr:hypothetical protein [Campylobacter vulpis]MBS4240781.1 hypothetical protein [Campylobacter vulpis]MBS4253091.1 hypothetical protein [Campylobacter vulpis]MBS4281632.1 hypothetical protein [Campylobacter vulpis]MBS4329910.1 hypothetical protein [Campylobacter vulpis]MBS4330943.1 hypothetical protein [Campylobacter vulpis]
MLLANIYKEFSDFAYEKKAGQGFKISDVKLVDFYQNKEFCLQMLIGAKEVRVLKNSVKCEKLAKDKSFLTFLNGDFLSLYHQDDTALQKELQSLKKAMRDIMVYYKLRLKLDKAMIKDSNVSILKLDENGGTLFYKINHQACVGIELFKEDKMKMKIYGIENLDKECKFFISSPAFKELSYTKNEFRLYVLE